MTVNISKPAVNVREKLAELDKPTGIAGEAMLRAETPQEQFNLIGAGRRNLIINGDMRIAQRGTSFTGLTTSNTKTLDRFQTENGTSATYTVEQITDAPSGFTWSLKSTVTTADTSLGGSDFMQIKYSVEGYDFTASGFGTSDAKHLTLSFYVKCSKAGTFSAEFTNSAQDRHCAATFTVDVANTWQRVYATIPPCTDGTWLSTNGAGLEIRIGYSRYGATYEAANTSDVVGKWRSVSTFNDAFPVSSINLAETVNATFQITGVQLELGKVATPFEHRSYGEELALCQRYFEAYSGSSSTGYMPMGMAWTTNEPRFDIRYLEKRVAPTISLKSGSTLKSYNAGSGTEYNWSNFNVDDATAKTALIYGNNSMAATQGYAIQTRLIGNIFIDAEL